MKVTKQQKILGGIMLLGAVALICDQFVFSSWSADEQPGDPSGYAVVATNNAPAKAAPITAAAASPNAPSIAQRLRQAGKQSANQPTNDAFAPPAAWTAPAPVVAQVDTSAQKFRETHRLTGILNSGGKSCAMLDDKLVVIGQSIDGFTLASISHRTASFAAGENKVVLTMPDGAGGSIATVAP